MSADRELVLLESSPACRTARATIDERLPEMLTTLKRWAAINSGSDNSTGLERMAKTIIDDSQFLGFEPEILYCQEAKQPCAIRWRRLSAGQPTVLLNGHLDTVYESDHPFQDCEEIGDGKLRGPGVTDMKGGLVILFSALRAFLESEVSNQLGWEVLITFDEEIGSFKSKPYLEEAAANCDFGLVFESSIPDGKLVRNRLGTGVVTVTVEGRSAHAGRDFEKGRNAIVAASCFVERAHRLNTIIPGGIVNAGRIEGGGPVNVVPAHAEVEFNLRADTSETEASILDALEAIGANVGEEAECKVKIAGGFTRPAKVATRGNECLFSALKTVARAEGYELDWRDTGGASDGNIFQAEGLINIDNLGAIGDRIHSSSEYIFIDSLRTRSRLVACFLIGLASGAFDAGELSFIEQFKAN